MLSNASKYAIKAMLYLALESNKYNKLGAKPLAKTLKVPEPFLAKILQQLVKSNLLSSTKGPHGGFYISEENAQNNICKVIENIDGQPMFINCFMGLEKCDESNPCPLHNIVVDFRENLMKKFNDMTLAEFAKDTNTQSAFLK